MNFLIGDNNKHFSGKVVVKALLTRNGRILITLDGRWELPGGRLDEGESVSQALARELYEELGIIATAGPLVYSEQYVKQSDGSSALLLVLQASWDDSQKIIPHPHEIKDILWISADDLNEIDFYPNILNALRNYFGKA